MVAFVSCISSLSNVLDLDGSSTIQMKQASPSSFLVKSFGGRRRWAPTDVQRALVFGGCVRRRDLEIALVFARGGQRHPWVLGRAGCVGALELAHLHIHARLDHGRLDGSAGPLVYAQSTWQT